MYYSIGSHWIALYALNNNVTYFNSFGAEHIPKEVKKLNSGSNITPNIYRVQAFDSVMCGYFCRQFIDLMLKGKSLTDFTNQVIKKR